MDHTDDVGMFNKRIALLLNRNRLTDGEHQSVVCNCLIIDIIKKLALPALFSDIDKRVETWGKQGTIDPFKCVYDVRGPCTSFVVERIFIQYLYVACLSNDCPNGQL